MADNVRLVNPSEIDKNPSNPRLIFRADELNALEKSISKQGILVPLTVYRDGRGYKVLDGERRWRCSLKLGLAKVPVIVQPKPDELQNIMMMFAIHKARSDWDPLPTAIKLEELEATLTRRYGRQATEAEVAAAASLDRGEVRRYKRILALPQSYRDELMLELEKPRAEQVLTVDNILESVRAAESLRKREVINEAEEAELSSALVQKFRTKVLSSTVEPRLLPRMARAVERGDITKRSARSEINKLVSRPSYTVNSAYDNTVRTADLEHTLVQAVDRLSSRLEDLVDEGAVGESVTEALRRLRLQINRLLRNA